LRLILLGSTSTSMAELVAQPYQMN